MAELLKALIISVIAKKDGQINEKYTTWKVMQIFRCEFLSRTLC